METLPRRIKREIKRANRKANRLRRKLGLKNAKSICNKNNITEIEIKVPYEDFINGKIPSLKDVKEYAYFYNRDDGYFGAEKIKDGKLKEYYHYNYSNFLIRKGLEKDLIKNNFNFSAYDVFEELENTILPNNDIFYVNGKLFFKSYYSINKNNEMDDIYYYESGFSKVRLLTHDKEGILGREIIRVSNKTKKINKVYFETQTDDNRTIFYYYDASMKCQEVLLTLAISFV